MPLELFMNCTAPPFAIVTLAGLNLVPSYDTVFGEVAGTVVALTGVEVATVPTADVSAVSAGAGVAVWLRVKKKYAPPTTMTATMTAIAIFIQNLLVPNGNQYTSPDMMLF